MTEKFGTLLIDNWTKGWIKGLPNQFLPLFPCRMLRLWFWIARTLGRRYRQFQLPQQSWWSVTCRFMKLLRTSDFTPRMSGRLLKIRIRSGEFSSRNENISMPLTLIRIFFHRLTQDTDDKPLVVILSWLQAKQKHLSKYAQLYMDQGFDVLVAQITPWQLLWPVKGSQVNTKWNKRVRFNFDNNRFPYLSASSFRLGDLHANERLLQANGSTWILCWWIYVVCYLLK